MKPYKRFMLESNRIEGEDGLNPDDIEAVEYALTNISCIQCILTLHSILGRYLEKNWVGKWRNVDVRVGIYAPPAYIKIPNLMLSYMKDFPKMDSWEAHNEFEKIHPFQDLNGRVGRLIWLSKAICEGYNFSIPFLQAYYYQSLGKYEISRLTKPSVSVQQIEDVIKENLTCDYAHKFEVRDIAEKIHNLINGGD